MARSVERKLTDFGFDPLSSPYHFALVVQRDAASVLLEERFQVHAAEPHVDEVQTRPALAKASLDPYRWSRVAEAARADFNNRLTADGGRAAKWRTDETLLAPHLGKELALLFWVIEDADASVVPNMVANWTGLAPEERWWLYTTINATAGHPEHGRERGWRKAVKIALAENPASVTTPGGWLTRVDADRPEPRAATAPIQTPTSKGRDGGDQLRLLPDEALPELRASQGVSRRRTKASS
jgi:hypothetical protein